MTTFTSRNVPLAQSTDPADIAARLNPVAQLQHDRPGVSALTTTERNALTGAELWDGRMVLNTTTDRLNRYDLGTTTWVQLPDSADIVTLLATTGLPAADGTATRGVAVTAARSDHVHPQPALETITVTAGQIVLGALVSTAGDGVRADRKNGVVTLEVYISAGGSLSDILTMPTGWRPPGGVRHDMNLGATNVTRAVNLNSAGLLSVEGGMTNGVTLFGSMTYVTAG